MRPTIQTPEVIPPEQHSIEREHLGSAALQVLDGLAASGYRACLVGGAIRDLLLGITPKDFDVSTDAEPEQIAAAFGRRARLIGRRFQIVHVRFGRELIEVSTFRADPDAAEEDQRRVDASGRVLSDNVFGSMAEDASRRDFAINGLYYDIADGCLYDYVGGVADARDRRLRLIGEPDVRYREDPVRMLRAVRLSASHGLTIDAKAKPPRPLIGRLADVPPARLFDEVLKLLMQPRAPEIYAALRHYGLFGVLFEQTEEVLAGPGGTASATLIEQAIANTADRIAAGNHVTPAFIFAAILWPAVRETAAVFERDGTPAMPALASAQAEVVSRQSARVSIPKRFSMPMRDIWHLQPRFHRRRGKQPVRLLEHQRFRAAYDFLLLRAQIGEVGQDLADWWTERQQTTTAGNVQDSPEPDDQKQGGGRRGHRRRRGGRSRS